MKKAMIVVLAILGLAFIMGCTTTSSSAAAPMEKEFPAPEGQIADAVWGTPAAIDGSMDPAFEKATPIETGMETMGDNAATAKAWMLWDNQYVYVHLEVMDPKLSDANANPWEKDSIEVFIDEKNTKTDKYTAGDAQYRVNFKNEKSVGTGGSLDKMKSGAMVIDGGYAVTIAVPFLVTKPVAGSYIGFDVQVNDDDGSGMRTGQRNWNDDTNNGWQNASVFGNLHLRSK
jgi:endo-1,4-beta-xylanase